MLNSMREGQGAKFIKYVALGFVLLATLGMVFMDVGGFFRGGMSGNQTLAEIGRVKIDQQTFERTSAAAMRSQNMTLQEAYRFGLLKNLLDEMVTRESMRQEAQDEGLQISREDIAARVHDLIRLQIQPGETPQEALTRLLSAQGLSEADLTNGIRQDNTARMIEEPLRAAATYLPRLTAEALGRYQGERRDIVFFTLTPEGVGRDIKADEETLKAYYETVKDQYQIPEERTFKAIVLSSDDIKKSINITDADVRAAYEERKDQFRVGERRKIEQVVLTDETKAKTAAESARKGRSLRSTAPDNYREPMDIEQTGLPAELGAAVFGADKGTVLNPIKTPLGWHVIKVLAVVPARSQAYNEVQANLRKELESDALHTEMESRISKADEMLGSGSSLDEVAKDMGVTPRNVGPIDQQGNVVAGENADPLLTALAQNKDVLAGLFELMEGETGDLSEVSENIYAAFSLDTVRPTRDRDFAEVKDDIEKKWLAEQRNDALAAQVEKLAGEVSRGEKDFAEAAKDSGAVVKTARDVSRQSKVAGLNDPVALTRLFDETDFKAVVKVPTEGGAVILAKVLDARIPDAGAGKLSAEQETQLRTQMQQAVVQLFIGDLRARHDAVVMDEHLQKIYGSESDAQQ